MYGTVAHFRLKPGIEEKLLDIKRELRETGMTGFRPDIELQRMSARSVRINQARVDETVVRQRLIYILGQGHFWIEDQDRWGG